MASPDREFACYFSANVSTTWDIYLKGYRNALYPGASGAKQLQAGYDPAVVSPQATTPRTLTAADNDRVFTNEGAAATIVFNLPTAVAGLTYRFIVQDSDGIQVTAASGDTIRVAGSVSAAAGNIAATAIGNTVYLVAINATEWVALSHEGTWVVT